MKNKYNVIFGLFIICLFGAILYIFSPKTSVSNLLESEKKTKTKGFKEEEYNNKTIVNNKSSIFIPYWALPQSKEDIDTYDRLLYFGVFVDENGVARQESGYRYIEAFQTATKGFSGKKTLVIRMLDTEKNINILNNEQIQNKIISEINEVVKDNGFSELALDLELSGIFNVDIANKINVFVQKIYTLKNRYYRHFSVIMYGDIFYRNRPFDIKTIGQNCDELMIMAYDFSKPYGEPGPNFPFDRQSRDEGERDDFGYDFKQMIADFSSHISPEKLTVIFGMYGYDWTINNQGTPLKRAEAVTVNQIYKLTNDKLQITNQIQNSNTKEKRIEYLDEENQKHIIWYEDMESAQVKTDYLKGQGVGSVSFWAYSYF